MCRKYYEAYEERYKTAHAKGVHWMSEECTPIVMEVIEKYDFSKCHRMLEIGCGEGRDSKTVLEAGYDLLATDISDAAIQYCKKVLPAYAEQFDVLDCLSQELQKEFDFIFAVAVIHMLVLENDRAGFYQFIGKHLNEKGLALICTMGDGEMEVQSDIHKAFELQEREHETGKMKVAGTSCRMVSWATFEKELVGNGLEIVEKGMTSSLPDFNSLMYVVVRRA